MALMQRIGRTSGGATVILIRLLVGWVFVCEGVGKFLYPSEQAAGRFDKIPAIPWPQFFGPFVGTVEVVFGTLVLLGLLTRVAALVLLIDITVAILTTKFPILAGHHYGLPDLKHYNFWGMLHEARTDFSMWLGCLFLLVTGGGRWSLDARMFGGPPRAGAVTEQERR
jgi:putative oxidoreductase